MIGFIPPCQVITNASMASSFVGTAVNILYSHYVGIQFIWTGTPTGTLGVQVSNVPVVSGQIFPGPGTFTALTLSDASPPIINPSGAPGSFYLDLTIGAGWIQPTYTFGSGTGTMNAYLVAKM